jgi:hypothetical protein
MKWKTSNGDKMTGIEFLRDRRQSEMVRREKSAAAVRPAVNGPIRKPAVGAAPSSVAPNLA